MKYDFGGWATRNDLPCADGRVIKKDAFKAQNGQTVPLVWMHNHADPANVLGLAHLENRDEGVYAFCEFNDTESGKTARELVKHGDVQSLSIFANQLKQAGHDVVHGIIREVSLVLAGANPGAFIDDVVMHGDGETGIILGYNEMIMGQLEHSADEPDKKKKEEKDEPNDESGNGEKKDDKVETIEDIFKSMNEKQQTAVFAMMAEFVDKENPKKEDDESKGGDDNMKHNVFDTDKRDDKSFLSHAAQKEILDLAKSSGVGSLKSTWMNIVYSMTGLAALYSPARATLRRCFRNMLKHIRGVHLNSLQMIWDGLTLLWRRHRKFRMVAFVLPM